MFTDKIALIACGGVGIVLAASLAGAVVLGAKVGKERDHHLGWAKNACAAVGSTYEQKDKKGNALPYRKWGAACIEAIRESVRFKAEAGSQTIDIITTHNDEQARKRDADLAKARRDLEQTRKALKRMEAANAAVQDNCVTGDWFDALNELGGVQPHGKGPAEARAPCSGEAAQGSTVR